MHVNFCLFIVLFCWVLHVNLVSNMFFTVSQLYQLFITMATAQQAVITPRMSSTSVLTAGCASTTRQWRSSTSTRWWSRLPSAPPTCCTTAASTCCRHTRQRTHKYSNMSTNTKPTRSNGTHWQYSTSARHKHNKLMNRNTAQLVLLQDFFLFLPPDPAVLRTSFSSTLFLVSFFLFGRRETSCIHKCFPVTALFSLHHGCVCFFVFFPILSYF